MNYKPPTAKLRYFCSPPFWFSDGLSPVEIRPVVEVSDLNTSFGLLCGAWLPDPCCDDCPPCPDDFEGACEDSLRFDWGCPLLPDVEAELLELGVADDCAVKFWPLPLEDCPGLPLFGCVAVEAWLFVDATGLGCDCS